MVFAVEVVVFLLTALFAILWVRDPQGNYEPWIAVFGLITAGFEIVRRLSNNEDNSAKKPIQTPIAVANWLAENATSKDLTDTLPVLMNLASKIGDSELEKWARLEYNGYNAESGMEDEDVVPEYRIFLGTHMDVYGRPLIVRDPKMSFINENRLRCGIKELKNLAHSTEPLYICDANHISIIKKHMGLDIVQFEFSPLEVRKIISNIEFQLLERANKLRKALAQKTK